MQFAREYATQRIETLAVHFIRFFGQHARLSGQGAALPGFAFRDQQPAGIAELLHILAFGHQHAGGFA